MNGLVLFLTVLLAITATTFALGGVILLLGRFVEPAEATATGGNQLVARSNRPNVSP